MSRVLPNTSVGTPTTVAVVGVGRLEDAGAELAADEDVLDSEIGLP